ncbi:MAG: hypothetical protein GY910_16415 [bacterium]|nr:hypothetical protein [bacterium]
MLAPAGSKANTLELTVTYRPFLDPSRPSLRIEAAADGRLLDSWTSGLKGRLSKRLRVSRLDDASRWLELRLKYDKPLSPADRGHEGDARQLAIGLEEISWRPCDP